MSNTILSRPLRPLCSSISGSSSSSNLALLRSSAPACATPSKTPSTTGTPLEQRRFAATTRRHNKALKSVPSAPVFTAPASANADTTLIYNPPSAMPSVYHTPLKFLPPGDRRRQLAAVQARVAAQQMAVDGQSPVTRTGTALSAASAYSRHASPPSSSSEQPPKLPPALRTPYAKKYHLTAVDIAEIRRLRALDPATWTRQKLADKFECSQFFVGLVAPAPEHAQRKADEVEAIKARWGPRRREAREERRRRKESWGRGA
ncbi:mitochondrial 54S ribosomal mL58 domain-containing protein [Phyllosticta capitalensis]|uniref:mitochondrial 54S ribosomal mL58 domain-containing protein n=1 Tax=Phyllosticta capitalensis TaxID=121624 RepID=UPI0031326F2E